MSMCQSGTQCHAQILDTGGVTSELLSTCKLTYGDSCHSCEFLSTFREAPSCFVYLQGRCVYVPIRDPTSCADDPENWSTWGFRLQLLSMTY